MKLAKKAENENNQTEAGKWKWTGGCPTDCEEPDEPIYKYKEPCKIKEYVHFFQEGKGLKVRACDLIEEKPLTLSWETGRDNNVPVDPGFWDLDKLRFPVCLTTGRGRGYDNGCSRAGFRLCLKDRWQCKVDEIWVPQGVAVH